MTTSDHVISMDLIFYFNILRTDRQLVSLHKNL